MHLDFSNLIEFLVILFNTVLVLSDEFSPEQLKNFGTVYNTESCGGDGSFVRWRLQKWNIVTPQTALKQDPNAFASMLIFYPSEDIEELGARLVFNREGSESTTQELGSLPGSENISEGNIARIDNFLDIPLQHQGNKTKVQFILYNAESGGTEVCGQTEFQKLSDYH